MNNQGRAESLPESWSVLRVCAQNAGSEDGDQVSAIAAATPQDNVSASAPHRARLFKVLLPVAGVRIAL